APEPVATAATNFAAAMPAFAASASSTTFFEPPCDMAREVRQKRARVQLVPSLPCGHHPPLRRTSRREVRLKGFTFEIPPRVTFLEEEGALVAGRSPPMPDAKAAELYRHMLRSRLFDDRMLKLQRQGRIGTFAPSFGQEACQVGSLAALTAKDWFVP